MFFIAVIFVMLLVLVSNSGDTNCFIILDNFVNSIDKLSFLDYIVIMVGKLRNFDEFCQTLFPHFLRHYRQVKEISYVELCNL